MKKLSNIKVIAFGADDTLWANENHFKDFEEKFEELFLIYMNWKIFWKCLNILKKFKLLV